MSTQKVSSARFRGANSSEKRHQELWGLHSGNRNLHFPNEKDIHSALVLLSSKRRQPWSRKKWTCKRIKTGTAHSTARSSEGELFLLLSHRPQQDSSLWDVAEGNATMRVSRRHTAASGAGRPCLVATPQDKGLTWGWANVAPGWGQSTLASPWYGVHLQETRQDGKCQKISSLKVA